MGAIIEFLKGLLRGRKANHVVVEVISRNNRGRITDRTALIMQLGGELTFEDEAGGEISLHFYGPNGESHGTEVDQPEERWAVFLHDGSDDDGDPFLGDQI